MQGPAGKTWGPSTIYGNWQRGTGILNNELYVGRLVWNRQQFIKDPNTGRRQARLNPEAKWIIEEVPTYGLSMTISGAGLKSGSGMNSALNEKRRTGGYAEASPVPTGGNQRRGRE